MKRFIKLLSVFILISLLFGTTVLANYWGGTRSLINNQVRYYYDSSIINKHYDSDISRGCYEWNKASNSKQTKVTMAETLSNGPLVDEYYVSSSSDPNLLGITICYKKNFWGNYVQCSESDNWQFCKVYLYDNNISGRTPDQRTRTATHEMGHTLKLAHTTSSDPSVMKQTKDGGASEPTNYDANQLYYKWGHR